MNNSFITTDRGTHLKVLMVAALASAMVISIAVNGHMGTTPTVPKPGFAPPASYPMVPVTPHAPGNGPKALA